MDTGAAEARRVADAGRAGDEVHGSADGSHDEDEGKGSGRV